MLPSPMDDWSAWAWFLHLAGAAFLVGFLWFFFAFAVRERRARGGDEAAIQVFNRGLRGFPNFIYAKMLGKTPLRRVGPPKTP